MAIPSRCAVMLGGNFRFITRHQQTYRSILRMTAHPKTLMNWTSVSRAFSQSKTSPLQHNDVFCFFKAPFRHITSSSVQNTKSPFESLIGEDKNSRNQEIRLLGLEDQDMGLMTKGKAEAVARENSCKIVLIHQKSDELPVYTLMSGGRYMEEKMHRKKEMKQETKKSKKIEIGSKITDHDLHIKVSHIRQMLRKGHTVNVKISNHKSAKDVKLVAVFKKVVEAVQEEATMRQGSKSSDEIQATFSPVAKQDPSDNKAAAKPYTQDEHGDMRKKAGSK